MSDLITTVRGSLIYSLCEKYGNITINLLSMVILSRLLSPDEMGIFFVATALASLMNTLREFGATQFIIQEREITRSQVRAAFTISLLFSSLFALIILAGAGEIARLYEQPELQVILYFQAAGFIISCLAMPTLALLRRDMEFKRLALIGLATTAVNAIIGVLLAVQGFGTLSLAWGSIIASLVGTAMIFAYRPDWALLLPKFSGWRDVLHFGSYSSASALLNVGYQAAPQLILGRMLDFAAVGLYGRAVSLSAMFDRFVLDALHPVILPAFAAHIRSGKDLRGPYLMAIEYVTAIQWPFLIFLAVMADPIVVFLLGDAWHGVASLVRILSIASLVMFPAFLTYPVLVALGRIQDTLAMSLITIPASLIAIFIGSFFGLTAVAAVALITSPFQVWIALHYIRRRISFSLMDLVAATRRSAIVTVFSALSPVGVLALSGASFSIPFHGMLLALLGSAVGWLVGMVVVRHPFLEQLSAAIGSGVTVLHKNSWSFKGGVR